MPITGHIETRDHTLGPVGAKDPCSMNAVMCAVLSGDTRMLRLLAESSASMNHSLEGIEGDCLQRGCFVQVSDIVNDGHASKC